MLALTATALPKQAEARDGWWVAGAVVGGLALGALAANAYYYNPYWYGYYPVTTDTIRPTATIRITPAITMLTTRTIITIIIIVTIITGISAQLFSELRMRMSVVASGCRARDKTKPGSFAMFADAPAPRCRYVPRWKSVFSCDKVRLKGLGSYSL